MRAVVRVLQQFVRDHSEAASAANAAGNLDDARSHQLLADIARDAIPAGWSPPAPPWSSATTIVEAINHGIASAAQFADANRGEGDALAQLRQSVQRAANPAEV